MSTSRTENSIKNSATGLLSQGITILLKFAVRLVFLNLFTREYLGINGLFSNILTVLSLTELGVGDALIFSMYKPLSSGDEDKLTKLMKLYSKAYTVIGISVFIIGALLIPLLPFIVENMPTDPYLLKNFTLIYLIFLINATCSYFFSYKRSIINADQKGYIINNYSTALNIFQSVLQITVLLVCPKPISFILYLSIQILVTLLTNFLISSKANRLYPFIKAKTNLSLNKKEQSKIFKNIRSLTVYKIGGVALDGTDNIIISKFCGLNSVGSLSNYTLVTSSLLMFLTQISNSVIHSVGNIIATEDKKKSRLVFDSLVLINFLVYGFSSVCLFALFPDFIKVYAGEEYLLPVFVTAIIATNFFLYGSMSIIWTYRSTMGLFVYGKYRPIISAVVNIVISIILANYLDIAGVLIGTTITRLVTNIWFDPYIIFKHGFKESVIPYYLIYVRNFLIIAVLAVACFFINSLIPSGILFFLLKVVITLLLAGGVLVLIFFKTKEFKFLYSRVRNVILEHKNNISTKQR